MAEFSTTVLCIIAGIAFVLLAWNPRRGAMVRGSKFSLTERLDTKPRLIGADDLWRLLSEMEYQGCIVEIRGSHEEGADRNKIHVIISYHPGKPT